MMTSAAFDFMYPLSKNFFYIQTRIYYRLILFFCKKHAKQVILREFTDFCYKFPASIGVISEQCYVKIGIIAISCHGLQSFPNKSRVVRILRFLKNPFKFAKDIIKVLVYGNILLFVVFYDFQNCFNLLFIEINILRAEIIWNNSFKLYFRDIIFDTQIDEILDSSYVFWCNHIQAPDDDIRTLRSDNLDCFPGIEEVLKSIIGTDCHKAIMIPR